jgi:hypothetical protein
MRHPPIRRTSLLRSFLAAKVSALALVAGPAQAATLLTDGGDAYSPAGGALACAWLILLVGALGLGQALRRDRCASRRRAGP